MSSRIGNHINFPNYETEELVEIAQVMCRDLEYEMDPACVPKFRDYIAKRKTLPFFSNARTIRNTVDRARMRSAIRLFNEKMAPGSDGNVEERELMYLSADDFPSAQELEALGENAIVE